MSLEIRPCTIRAAVAWVREVHRHLPTIQGGMWAVQVLRDGEQVGVAIVGHPARLLMAEGALAVLRVAVLDGQPNACSALYGACARATRAMGASGLVTYTLAEEPGTSLRAAGWVQTGETAGGTHSRPSRQRRDPVCGGPKRIWWAPWSDRAK